ncbi:MAG TPA: hypothetical protein VFH80_31145 [Solirubrobacteraceae bacterium]|nr:hypothetical protein [Solirubrobacteraceae bacterium]
MSGGTYSSLTVPSGQFCFLSNATILGNATVQSTASLEFDQNGTIYESERHATARRIIRACVWRPRFWPFS